MRKALLLLLLFFSIHVHAAVFMVDAKGINVMEDINIGDLYALQEVYRAAPSKTIIFRRNEGGNINEAIEIARWIERMQLNTHVVEFCRSACVYAFAGGIIRTMEDSASLDVHQMWAKNGETTDTPTVEAVQTGLLLLWNLLESRGVDAAALIRETLKHPSRHRTFSRLGPASARLMGLIN